MDITLLEQIKKANLNLLLIKKHFSSEGYWKLQLAINLFYAYCLLAENSAENKGCYWFGPRKKDYYPY